MSGFSLKYKWMKTDVIMISSGKVWSCPVAGSQCATYHYDSVTLRGGGSSIASKFPPEIITLIKATRIVHICIVHI